MGRAIAFGKLEDGRIPSIDTIRVVFRSQIETRVADDDASEIKTEDLTAAVTDWRSTVIGDLAKLVRTDDDDTEATDLEILRKPSAIFNCEKCGDHSLVFPGVADHECVLLSVGDGNEDGDGVPLPSNVIVGAGVEELAYAIVDAVGLDVASTTLDDLVKRGNVFILAPDDEDEAIDLDDPKVGVLSNFPHTYLEVVRLLHALPQREP